MKVSNEQLLALSDSWDEEDKKILISRLGKSETDLIQVYKLFQIEILVRRFFPDQLSKYKNMVINYQDENSDSLQDVIVSHRNAEYRAFKEILNNNNPQ